MRELKVGYAREDFSPDKPVRMNSQRTGERIRERVYATAMSLCQGEQRVLLIALDLRELHDHFTAILRPMLVEATGVPSEAIVLVTSHNHSSPDSSSATDEAVLDWRDRIGLSAIVRAAKAAIADEKLVTRMTGGKKQTEQISFVRRYMLEDGTWSGIATANPSKAPKVAHESDADLELRAVRLHREGGKDIILVNYQTHAASALKQCPEEINADFIGPLRDKLEQEGDALVVYLQGACGNTNYETRIIAEKHLQKKHYWEVGEALAETTQAILAQAEEMELGDLQFVSGAYNGVVNHSRDYLLEQAIKIGEETDPDKRLELMHAAGINSRYDRGAIIKRAAMPEIRPMEISSISLGDFAMAFAPLEMFDILGVQLRQASPFAMTFPCGYAHNYRGYMPSHQMFPHGEYEAYMCHYLPGSGEGVVLALCEQLQELKKRGDCQ